NQADLGTLEGKTLGIVGLGAIGTAVARLAEPFGMRIVGLRRTAAPAPRPSIEVMTSLTALLNGADHVVISAPATPATRHLIDADALASMKPGTHLVNVARGSLVDQDALVAALDAGRLGRATLDVVEPEPLPPGHPLYTHERVRLTPHVSWSS